MIYAYLRASTEDQNNERAKGYVSDFATTHNIEIDAYFTETVSGRDFNKPVLLELISKCNNGDIILVEQIDRLTRLTESDWLKLKHIMQERGVHVVSIDLPTSYAFLNQSGDVDELTGSIMRAVNNMMLDLLAAISSKDYTDRRRRQAEGIKAAQKQGKYKGKQVSQETIDKCLKAQRLINENGLTIVDAVKAAGVNRATFYNFKKRTEGQVIPD